MPDQPSDPPHWSKDFVEHLRTVHFALIGACAAVILAAASVKPYDPANAVTQVNEIIELQRLWGPKFVTRLGETYFCQRELRSAHTIDPLGPPFDYYPEPVGMLGTLEWIGLGTPGDVPRRTSPTKVVFVFPKLTIFDAKTHSGYIDGDNGRRDVWDEFPKTLADFHWWWDYLMQSPTIVIPLSFTREPIIHVSNPKPLRGAEYGFDYAKTLLSTVGPASAFEASLPRIQLFLMPEGGDPFWFGRLPDPEKFLYHGILIADDFDVMIPVATCGRLKLTQQKLVERFPNWQGGRFDQSFSDLARAAKGREALSLEDVQRIVSEDAGRGSEVLEIFGLKFPVSGVLAGGIPVILYSIQLYFFVYLRRLSEKPLEQSDPGWDVPWIGMDQSRLARCILFATIILLPCLSLGYWGYRTSLQQGNLWVVVKIMGFIPALIFGILSWNYRPGSIALDLSIFLSVSRIRRRLAALLASRWRGWGWK
jgi:hypothetical protein